jgi:hypothetical protein
VFRQRRFFGRDIDDFFDWSYKTISPTGKSPNVGGMFGVISKGCADLLNAEIQALVEIDKGFIAPDMIPDLFSSDNLTCAPDQKHQYLGGLGSELHAHSIFSQLSGRQF